MNQPTSPIPVSTASPSPGSGILPPEPDRPAPAGGPLSSGSPKWGSNFKLIVGLTVVGLIAALMIYFRNIIGPLLLAFILAFLIQPMASRLSQNAHISWRLAVNVIYLVLLVVVISTATVAGLAILQQAQSAITYITDFVNALPQTLQDISRQTYGIGPFQFDLTSLDLSTLAEQALGLVRPLLGEAGSLIGAVASGTVNTLGWGLFILLISYFLLSESGRWSNEIVHIEAGSYTPDLRRLMKELANTWQAFLRGQLIISLMVTSAYYLLLTILGTRLSLVIALMAGVAAFIPYVGTAILWVVMGIIAYLQTDNYFGLSNFSYALLVVGCGLVLNQIFDNLITPRILGDTLGVHPAGVLIAAIVATDLIGFVGLMLAAPVLATVMVLGRYISRKMLDQDPWAGPPPSRKSTISPRWMRLDRRIQAFGRWLQSRYR